MVTAFHFNQINVIPQHGIPKAAAQRANLAGKESEGKKKEEEKKRNLKLSRQNGGNVM